jgi:hypothetical protein
MPDQVGHDGGISSRMTLHQVGHDGEVAFTPKNNRSIKFRTFATRKMV